MNAGATRQPIIVDAHLDLSYNALLGRDVLAPASQQPADEGGIPTVGLPDLARGGVRLICATIFCMPSLEGKPGYRSAEEAYLEGVKHLDWYEEMESAGHFTFVRTPADVKMLHDGLDAEVAGSQPAILLLEGADPLRDPADLPGFFDTGVRIVGLAWRETRYAGGTFCPGPLKPEAYPLIKAMDDLGMIHDASHLAEESFWQLLKATRGPVMASHSNCRSIVPTDRQLSDDMILAIVERGGVIGINFFDKFLLPPEEYGKRRATLADVVTHARYICDLTGSTNHVAIGTDMDGGLGRNEIPEEIATSADLPMLAGALRAGGFGSDDVKNIMGGNWLRYFEKNLPTTANLT
jgi:membrane dipeptidase